MATTLRRDVSKVAQVPALTAVTIALALLALPAFVFVLDVTSLDLHPAVSMGVQWTVVAVVLGVAVWGEGLSLREVGFRRPAWIDVGYVVALSVAILAVYIGTTPLVAALGLPVRSGATAAAGASAGIGVAVARAVTTGVVEEILYRGYPIERLLAYTESPIVAGGLTWLIFTLAHAVMWPLGNLLQTALVAALITAVYLRRRTLVPVMGAHVLVWVVAALGQAAG